jgi:hypothetical protein
LPDHQLVSFDDAARRAMAEAEAPPSQPPPLIERAVALISRRSEPRPAE